MTSQSQSHEDFHTTRWSLIRDLNAGKAGARSRLNELCVRYWIPIHQSVLRRCNDEAQAEALSRDFFEHLTGEGLARAAHYKRFRDYLQGELDVFLEQASARGTAHPSARSTPLVDPAPGSIEKAAAGETLQRSFAVEVIGHSMARLRAEAMEADRLQMFERLQRYLSSEARPSDIEREAVALGARTLFVAMAIRRMRQRFRHLVDDELARLVTDPAELATEREAMLAALGSRG